MASINREIYKGTGRPKKTDYKSFLGLRGIVIGTSVLVAIGETVIMLVG